MLFYVILLATCLVVAVGCVWLLRIMAAIVTAGYQAFSNDSRMRSRTRPARLDSSLEGASGPRGWSSDTKQPSNTVIDTSSWPYRDDDFFSSGLAATHTGRLEKAPVADSHPEERQQYRKPWGW